MAVVATHPGLEAPEDTNDRLPTFHGRAIVSQYIIQEDESFLYALGCHLQSFRFYSPVPTERLLDRVPRGVTFLLLFLRLRFLAPRGSDGRFLRKTLSIWWLNMAR